MPKFTPEELEEYRRKLYFEFVVKLDQQPPQNRLRNQEDLLRQGSISATTLSRAFTNAKALEQPDATASTPAITACATTYHFLLENWIVEPDGTFKYIGQPIEIPVETSIILHDRFPKETVIKALAVCEHEIRIIDTYPSFLFSNQDHPDEINFLNWAEQSGKKLKLLVLDPTKHGIELRMNAAIGKPLLFDMPISAFRTALISAFKQLLDFAKDNPKLLEVKLMDEFPAMHGILLPGHAFFGFHFSHRLAHQASFMEIRGINSLYKDMGQHFEKIWNGPQSSYKLDQWAFDKISKVLAQKDHIWDSLIGRWEVYFQDKWKEDPKSHLSKISRAVLEIDPPYNNAQLSARLLFQDAELERLHTFDGNVRFERLKEGEFAFLVFSDHEHISIRLIIRCKLEDNNNFLLGHWVLTNAYDLNTSAIALFRVNSKLYPLPQFNIPFQDIKAEGVLNNLAFRNQNSFSLKALADKTKSNSGSDGVEMFEGHYLMYAYALGREKETKKLKKGIQLNHLDISSYGYVRYKSVKSTAQGKATVKRDNLYITLTDDSRDYRAGHFIFHTKDIKIEPEGIYAGVFLGIAFRGSLPIGRRVVLVKTDKNYDLENPSHIVANSPEYHALDKGLKKALSGRIKNLIGFLRSNGDIFTLDELFEEWERSVIFEEFEFLEFACAYALQNDKKKTIDLLERAIEFGFYDVDSFEDRIKDTMVFQELMEDSRYRGIKEKLGSTE